MELSKRLKAIYEMVPEGGILCDVGCDHAYLPIELVRAGKLKSAIACDINEGPLKRAAENISKEGLSDMIDTRLSDGLCEVRPGEADTISICGMGGNLVISILEKSFEVAKTAAHLVLSPQSDVEAVRAFIREHGFLISDEDMVCDEGKYYPVIKVDTAGEGGHESEAKNERTQCICDSYGPKLIEQSHPVLKEFLEKEQRRMEGILRALPPDAESRKKEIEEKLADIRFLCEIML